MPIIIMSPFVHVVILLDFKCISSRIIIGEDMNTIPKTNTHIHILTHGHIHHVSKGCFIGKIATSVKQGIHMMYVCGFGKYGKDKLLDTQTCLVMEILAHQKHIFRATTSTCIPN